MKIMDFIKSIGLSFVYYSTSNFEITVPDLILKVPESNNQKEKRKRVETKVSGEHPNIAAGVEKVSP